MGLSKKPPKEKTKGKKIRRKFDPKARPIWEEILEIADSIPEKEAKKLPRDLATNLDDYLYGGKSF